MTKKKIFFLSVGRSDYSRYKSIINELSKTKNISITLIVTGAHFENKFGNTFKEITKGNFFIKRLKASQIYNKQNLIQINIVNISILLSDFLLKNKPDLLVLSGDRYEMLAGAIASLGLSIPLVHLHGGAVTEGAIDEVIRHSISKMSHLHYVIHNKYKLRLMQMGEEEWRIKNFGAPGLDNIHKFDKSEIIKFEKQHQLSLKQNFCLACYHPVTLELADVKKQIKILIETMKELPHDIIFTYPNADPGTLTIINEIEKFRLKRGFNQRVVIIKNSGATLYNYLMSKAIFMIGNSSSGIVEAASFKLPVINIGTRQNGKVHPINVINSNIERNSIHSAIKLSLSPKFRKKIKNLRNPYGNGKSGKKIANSLINVMKMKKNILRKKFINYDIS